MHHNCVRFIWIIFLVNVLPAFAAPVPPGNVLFRPTFLSPDIAHYAGTAFRVKDGANGQPYFVTAHSLFGPAADMDVQMSSEDIARVIVAAVGVSCTDPRNVVVARNYVLLPGARRADGDGAEKDLAVFELPNRLGDDSLLLDTTPLVRGDKIWVYLKYAGTGRVGLESAVIAYVSEKEVRYFFENQEADFRGSTGAPIISAEGKVVGMNLGLFTSKTGRRFGYGPPATAIRAVWQPSQKPEASVLRPAP
ncbi:hypothetical protein IMCC26134_09330 [Verrucomicrobia bacterium IMCC26134]|nr:hypothetical protein IMCC26134_09330 [Verrucomicrobia bacterium IMCC26134]